MTSVDNKLESWSDVAKKQNWGTLLLGNGASITISQKYQYKSLYEKAKTDGHISGVEVDFF